MNSIPLTFSEAVSQLPAYTAVGGTSRHASTGLSAVLLYREKRFQQFVLFDELHKAGFDSIISIEENGPSRDLEGLSESFPFVRFILLKDHLTPGEQINLAALELSSKLFFVLWDDLHIIHAGGAQRMADRLGKTARLCTVPVIQNKRFETIPSISNPTIIKDKFSTMSTAPERENQLSLFPYDGTGIYDREKFIRVGGFDNSIKNFHWQLLDFGLRSCLWGEEIAATLAVKLAYEKDAPEEDSSPDTHYRRFYLKNIAPVFRGDYANLPLRRFMKYFSRSGTDVFSAWKEFAEARRFVDSNKRYFTRDAKILAESWT